MLMTTKTKVILSFITIFLLGGISGYIVRDSFVVQDQITKSEQYQNDHSRFDTEQERREHRKQMRERAKNRLTNYLELSDEQKQEFFTLLETYHTDIRDTVQTIRSLEDTYIREHYDEFKSDLSGLLNSRQLNRLDRFFHPDSVRSNRMNRNYRD